MLARPIIRISGYTGAILRFVNRYHQQSSSEKWTTTWHNRTTSNSTMVKNINDTSSDSSESVNSTIVKNINSASSHARVMAYPLNSRPNHEEACSISPWWCSRRIPQSLESTKTARLLWQAMAPPLGRNPTTTTLPSQFPVR